MFQAYEYQIATAASPFGSATPELAAQVARGAALSNAKPFVKAGWEPISVGGGGVDAPEQMVNP